MRRVAVVLLLALALSGCVGGDKLSHDEMAERATEALVALEQDVGPGGRISGFDLAGGVIVEVEILGEMVPTTLQTKGTVLLGTAGDVLIEGKVARVTYAAYCSPERIVMVTDGFEEYRESDQDFEARNFVGVCTGRGAEPLLSGLGDFEFADPSILTGHFDPAALELVSVESTGKKTFDAVYRSGGVVGQTDITVHLKGRDIQGFTAENPESRLTLTPVYGERGELTAPEAGQRYPGAVLGTGDAGTGGYEWTATSGSGGALSDYAFRVYADGQNVACTDAKPDPIVEFRLEDGAVQDRDGWSLTFQDDGDGLLGAGDWALIQHPARGSQTFAHEVVVWDLWADAKTSTGCSVPGPGFAATGLGVLAALGFAARRRA